MGRVMQSTRPAKLPIQILSKSRAILLFTAKRETSPNQSKSKRQRRMDRVPVTLPFSSSTLEIAHRPQHQDVDITYRHESLGRKRGQKSGAQKSVKMPRYGTEQQVKYHTAALYRGSWPRQRQPKRWEMHRKDALDSGCWVEMNSQGYPVILLLTASATL